jgi:hypothetical protein
MSTAVRLGQAGRPEIELPDVAAALRLMLDQHCTAGLLLRTFTDRTAFTTEEGLPIPLKELRGWALHEGRLHPLDEAALFDAHCTDAATGEPLPPERGLAYRDAWEVII